MRKPLVVAALAVTLSVAVMERCSRSQPPGSGSMDPWLEEASRLTRKWPVDDWGYLPPDLDGYSVGYAVPHDGNVAPIVATPMLPPEVAAEIDPLVPMEAIAAAVDLRTEYVDLMKREAAMMSDDDLQQAIQTLKLRHLAVDLEDLAARSPHTPAAEKARLAVALLRTDDPETLNEVDRVLRSLRPGLLGDPGERPQPTKTEPVPSY